MKGEVRLEQLLEADGIFQAGRSVTLAGVNGGERQTEIESFRRQHGRCVAKLKGIDGIDEAQRYIGSELVVPADSLPETDEGSYYTFELKGCQVYSDGEYIGTVTDVLDPGGTDILKVDLDDEETLIPFAESYLKSIDLDAGRIEVELPEGLRELNTAKGKEHRKNRQRQSPEG